MQWQGIGGSSILILFISLLVACKETPYPTPPLSLDGAPFLEINTDSILQEVEALSLEEKLGRLVFYQQKGEPNAEILQLVSMGMLSGVIFSDIEPSLYVQWRDSLKNISPLPLLISLDGGEGLNPILSSSVAFPASLSWQAVKEDSLLAMAYRLLNESAQQLSPDMIQLPAPDEDLLAVDEFLISLIESGTRRGILPIVDGFAPQVYAAPDSSRQLQSLLYYHDQLKRVGVAGLQFDMAASYTEEELILINQFVRSIWGYGGFIVSEGVDTDNFRKALGMDADLLLTNKSPQQLLEKLLQSYNTGLLTDEWLNAKVVKIYKAQWWRKQQGIQPKQEEVTETVKTLQASMIEVLDEDENNLSEADYYSHAYWDFLSRDIAEKGVVLATNPNDFIPVKTIPSKAVQILHLSKGKHTSSFNNYFGKYTAYESWQANDWNTFSRMGSRLKEADTGILVLHDYQLDSTEAANIRQWQAAAATLMIVNIQRPSNLKLLDENAIILQAFSDDKYTMEAIPQIIWGGISASGTLPIGITEAFTSGHGIPTEAIRLKYGIPQQAGIAPQALVGIDAIVNTAIDDKVFPGAQVLVAKDGKVIYSKAFGHHTYEKEQKVKTSDLYDLASITKVAATSLIAMQQYDQELYELNGKLKNYLPKSEKSRLRNITPKKLMSHRTGIQAHMPVVPYLLHRDMENRDCELYFCDHPSENFPVAVADSFYFSQEYTDLIWKDLYKLAPRKTKFKYSDVNFVLLQKLLEQKGGKRLDSMAYASFYEKLGLRKTLYNPLNHYGVKSIVPTQNDQRWRQQLVHGYVHDETAALMGGVAGHAGLFSTAEDLAVLFQLLLNEGEYGGHSFLKASTIRQFTKASYGNHRGLGFDKPKDEDFDEEGKFPQQASTALYGHTGFTGTCVWADPESDLIYIFLSNRVYPDAKNKQLYKKRIRERIHQVIYDAFGSFEGEEPGFVWSGVEE